MTVEKVERKKRKVAWGITGAGDKIAEFDRQYMLLRLDDFKAGLIQQEATLRRLKANLDVVDLKQLRDYFRLFEREALLDEIVSDLS